MCGGGGGNQTVRNITELSPEQREIFRMVMPALRDAARAPPKDFPGEKIAPFTKDELLARGYLRKLATGDDRPYTYTKPRIEKYQPNFSHDLQHQINVERREREEERRNPTTISMAEATRRWLAANDRGNFPSAYEWARAHDYTVMEGTYA